MADGNPFDAPLQSEIDEHQQAQAATVQASGNGNPFDEPLMSEKAEAQAGQNRQRLTPYDPAKFGRYTTAENYPQWSSKPPAAGPNLKAGEMEAWTGAHLTPKQAVTTAATTAAPALLAPVAGPLMEAAAPVINAAIEHLGNLDKIVKVAKTMGYGTFTLKEAHDLYKMFSGDNK